MPHLEPIATFGIKLNSDIGSLYRCLPGTSLIGGHPLTKSQLSRFGKYAREMVGSRASRGVEKSKRVLKKIVTFSHRLLPKKHK